MPRGTYSFTAGRVEAFSCAPGPAGWRYVSDRLDLACDKAFRPVRFVIDGRRGRAARLDDGTGVLIWPGQDGVDRTVAADVLLTESPGSWVATLRQAAPPGRDRLRRALVALGAQHCCDPPAAVVVERVGADHEQADLGDLLVEEWRLEWADRDPATVHLAGDVVLFAQGLPDAGDELELSALASPPNFR